MKRNSLFSVLEALIKSLINKDGLMISAKKLASEMADALCVDSNLFRGFLQGFVDLPVDFYYLGRDFIHTEDRAENAYDKERLLRLIKHGTASRQNLEKVIRLLMDDFLKHIDFDKVKEISVKGGGNFIGHMTFNQLATANMGYVLSSRLIPRLATGLTIGTILSLGAAMSRAVYVSRELQHRNSASYNALKRMGDLDLLYFLIADKTRPFEDAAQLWFTDREKFHQTCCYFFEKIKI
ncbi:hypothetical protein LQ939_01490 [Pantoea alhagi]|uniref:hypothetical protein n=1 Tax=Pantoea alhagi TaxID=1891675 RepID=UPI00202B802F|nr:hypothetical protein [Pantoea alhagi]URQ61085.1 hypothetical protein LQ939_01490 [Pantoea alhagi]